LVGAGRSELAQAIFGLDARSRGTVTLDGRPMHLHQPRQAIAAGVGLVPEDRKRQGLVLTMSCLRNVSLALHDRLSRWGVLRRRAERQVAGAQFDALRIKAASLDAEVSSLSGGNQQKVVLARWLARGGRLLIVDEPTRGVDVGAKAAIHELLLGLARQGVGILMISSELPELLALADRIVVLRGGRVVGEMAGRDARQESLLRMMAGLADEAAA
jgi:ABC-type sugar transport system ATPase subunit